MNGWSFNVKENLKREAQVEWTAANDFKHFPLALIQTEMWFKKFIIRIFNVSYRKCVLKNTLFHFSTVLLDMFFVAI